MGLRPEQLMFDPPTVAPDRLALVARERYGVAGAIAPLRGERDQNSLITTDDGRAYVLKIASPSEDPETPAAQCRALVHVEAGDPALAVPRVVRTTTGELSTSIDVDGSESIVRMLTFLPGLTFAEAGPLPLSALHEVGAFQGRLARALEGFDDPACRGFMPWALDSGLLDDESLWAGSSPRVADLVGPGRERVARATAALTGQRRQVVHNDGHRGNLLRPAADSFRVVGVIDFGDLVHTAVVADLAISAAGFLGDQPDPVAALAAMTSGFHAEMPLVPSEVDLLVDLVLARLTLSVLLTEYQMRHTPHIADMVGAELPGLLDGLRRWSAVDVDHATDVVHHTLGGLVDQHRQGPT